MEIKVPIEVLRERKLFLATPMYGGQCSGLFAKSVAELTGMCATYQIQMKQYFLFNESLITRARNYCVDEFLRSDCTHLMFIDSDIGFNSNDVLALMALQSDDSPYDVIAGPYPKKCISWEKIKAAVDKGVADENPNILERFVGDYVFNPANGVTQIPIDKPSEVLEAGTGFMMIRRKTFEQYAKAYPDISYKPDHVRTQHFDGSREIGQFFQAEIDVPSGAKQYKELIKKIADGNQVSKDEAKKVLDTVQNDIDNSSKRYLSEDYLFCQNVRKAGMKVWFCPWIQLQHVGSYIFSGSLADIAAIGVSPTADPDKLKHKKH